VTTGEAALQRRELRGWRAIENAVQHPRRRVLMLPGLFCSAEFFTDVLTQPVLRRADVAAVAADPPGFAGAPAPDGFEFSIESYAGLVEEFAATESIDLIVGHSLCANVGIEIAMRGRLPDDRFDELLAEMKRNPRSANRAQVVGFFEHIAAHGGEVASRLATASKPVWVGRGDRDEVRITDAERAILDAAPHVTLKTIPGAAHFSITDTPDQVAQLVVELLDS
jgi:pimeloyl-ACP methyl ester carboxylesterase